MNLRDYLSLLRRRLWTIALIVVLTAGAAIGVTSLQSPVYEARTRLLLGANQTTVDNGGFGQFIDANRVQTELQVLMGKPVADIVRADMGSAPGISASVVGTTAVIELTARAAQAVRAAEVADAYAAAYISYRQKQFTEAVTSQTKEYSRQIEALSAQIAQVEARPRGPNSPPPPEAETLRAQQSAFQIKLQQVDSAEKLSGAVAAVIQPATVPKGAVSPTPVRNVLVGILLGLILGVGAALLFDHLDDTVGSKEDIERTLPQSTVLGVIPLVPGWKNRNDPRIVSETDPTSPAAEAYRTLRTSIQFLGLDRSLRVLQVTSPVASEGKSTTLANLAVTLSHAGLRVIVVCCDLRRPRLNAFFGLPNDVGFTSVLLGQVPLADALQNVPNLPRLKVLASGPLPPNPSELLSSVRTADLLSRLGSQADIVLVDCPPVLPVTDAAVLANKVDGTLVVASAGRTTYKDLTRTVQLLTQVEAPLLGVVLNGGKTGGSYSYTYEYRPSAESPPSNGRGRKVAKSSKSGGSSSNGLRRKAS